MVLQVKGNTGPRSLTPAGTSSRSKEPLPDRRRPPGRVADPTDPVLDNFGRSVHAYTSIHLNSSIIEGNVDMLVLSRKEHQRIRLGDNITVTIVRLTGDQVRLGIDAPKHIRVLRDELEPHKEKKDQNS